MLSKVLSGVYNGLWYPALPVAALAADGFDPSRLTGRLALAQPFLKGAPNGRRFWLHCASVGEVNGCAPLVRELLAAIPESLFNITTMTKAGEEAASRARLGARVIAMPAPFDAPAIVRRFVKGLKPSLLLLAETELWPNYIRVAHEAGARIAVVNARMSERAMTRYMKLRPLFAPVLELVDLVLAQTEDDASRFARLGVAPNRIVITGNVKFDVRNIATAAPPRAELRRWIADAPVLVAGSTAPGEERVMLSAFDHLQRNFRSLKLVIAPRHLDRIKKVKEELKRMGVKAICASELVRAQETGREADFGGARVLLLDLMGELAGLYRHALVAFVGGSLFPGRGGQNLAEPAIFGIPVLFGPYHDKQQPLAAALCRSQGGFVVEDAEAVVRVVGGLLADEAARQRAGAMARNALSSMAGATQRSLRALESLINVC